MTAPVFHRLDKVARNLTPATLSLGLVIFAVLPLQVQGYDAAAPNIALIAVFYWAIYRPDLFPAYAAFLVGVWQDLLIGTPLGINALLLLVVHWALSMQRRFFIGKAFAVVWWAFAVIAAAAALGLWLLTMALHAKLIAPAPAAFQCLLTIAAYPFLTWVFARVQHAVLRQA